MIVPGDYIYLCLLTFLITAVTKGLCVRCYVCSYSPNDQNNRSDACTDENFQPVAISAYECPAGCKVYAQWDVNDELEQWRRNCAQEGDEITNQCDTKYSSAWKEKSCFCDRDYCNNAPWYTGSSSVFSTTLTLLCGLFLLRGQVEHF